MTTPIRASGQASSLEGSDRRAAADRLASAGRYLDAIDTLTEVNRRHRDPAVERELVRLRHAAFAEVSGPEPAGPWPPPVPDLFEGVEGLPELPFAEVTSDHLCSAVFHHGALLARGLLPPPVVAQLSADIEATMAAIASLGEGGQPGDTPWFTPFEVPGFELGMAGRLWVVNSGTVWVADSPRTLFDLVDALGAVGLADMMASIFGERPAMSVTKFALRRVPADGKGAWHQDSFLGTTTRTLNVWITLTECGASAPGLDVVPRRFDHFVERPYDPPVDYVVAQETVDRLAVETPVVQPDFQPGDALIFDQFLLHQTGSGSNLTEPRLGFECWFFAPSTYPEDNTPLVL